MRRTVRPLAAFVIAAATGVAVGGGLAAADLISPGTSLADGPAPHRSHTAAPSGDATSGTTSPAPDSDGGAPGTKDPQAEPVSAPEPATPDEEAPAAPSTPARPEAAPALWQLEDRGDAVREIEARLVQLHLLGAARVDGYFGTDTRDAVRRFQAAHGLDQSGAIDAATSAALRARTHSPTAAELHPAPQPTATGGRHAPLDPRCMTGRAVCVDKTTRELAWVVDGKVQMRLDVRFGSEFHPTREGAFSVYWKDADHVSNLYGSKMPYAMFFDGGEAVHFSSDFAARGYAGHSHGCVNTRDLAGTAALFGQVRVGDSLVVYRS